MNYVGIFDRYIKDFIFLKMTIFGFYIGCILFKIALVGRDQFFGHIKGSSASYDFLKSFLESGEKTESD